MNSRIRWFADSPDGGHPLCLCSWCAERIEGYDEDEYGFTVADGTRMWKQVAGKTLEARFHDRCFDEAVELGEIKMR